MFGIKRELKRIKKNTKKTIKSFSKNVAFSIGENCLADDILARNGLKSFSSPYSFARSNVEYNLAFEKESFSDFLNPEYVLYEDISDNKVGRNKKYTDIKNQYHSSCTNGFEFTHHDVIGNNEARKKICKRYKRLQSLKNRNIIMLYHHRLCEETDMEMLTNHLAELAQIYKKRKNEVHVFLFTQTIIFSESSRKVEHCVKNGIDCYNFHTLNVWAGDNDDHLWARCDNDLLETMINDIRKILR